MKIALITDTHLGARQGSKIFRNFFREQWKWFYEQLLEHGIERVIHGGDFFDTRNHVTTEDIDYVKKEFLPLVNSYNIKWDIIAGNHDVAYKNTNRVCSLDLLDSDNITTHIMNPYECVIGKARFAFIPWINSENHDSILEFITNIKDKHEVSIIGHFELIGMKMYATGSVCEHGLDPELFKQFKKVLSGHFHHSSKYNNIEYLGSAFCLTWQDYNDWRGFWIYDTDADTYTKIETPSSLFIEVEYPDKDVDIKDKFVKVIVDQEFKALELKDYIHWCQEQQPIKVVIDDRYTLSAKASETVDEDSEDDTIEVKSSILEYFKSELDVESFLLCEQIFTEADDKMKKGEV